jgi:hypothetical protein
MILISALNNSRAGQARTLESVKVEIRKSVADRPNFAQISDSTIENTIWSHYKPVASLWAAYLRIIMDYHVSNAEPGFPCRLDDLARFLGFAESVRRAGEACKLRQSRTTLLDPKTSWVVPPEVALPHFDIDWPI